AVPRALSPHGEALAGPIGDGAGSLTLRDARAHGRGQAHGGLHDSGPFVTFGAHGDVDRAALGRDAHLVLAADGDGDIAHSWTLRQETAALRNSAGAGSVVFCDARVQRLPKCYIHRVTAVSSQEGRGADRVRQCL